MRLLHKLIKFNVLIGELITIYILFIQSICEKSCTVWHSSLNGENSSDLERIQKVALKIILNNNYFSYKHALEKTGLQTLENRREQLCLNFAKKCTNNQDFSDIFPVKTVTNTRSEMHYEKTFANTKRTYDSAIFYMQRLLNKYVSNN